MSSEKDFYQLSKAQKEKLHKAFSRLNSLYDLIPKTKGCLENNCKENGCQSWCCLTQSPQMLYVEFLYILYYALRNWTISQISELVDRSVYHYIDNSPTKGCVFFNCDTNLCDCHKKRSLNCRIYGITPYEEFHPRYLKILEMYKDVPEAIIKDQCNLITTEDGRQVTVEDTAKWWKKLVDIERSIGVNKDLINDNAGGSYRAPHDHIIYYFLPDDVLYNLQKLRLSTVSTAEKKIVANNYLTQFHNKINKLLNGQ